MNSDQPPRVVTCFEQPRASCCDYHAEHGSYERFGECDTELRWGDGGPYIASWDCDDDMDDPPHRLYPPPAPVDDDR